MSQTMEQQSAIIALKRPNKRVNIISIGLMDDEGKVLQEPGILMRTTRSYAAKLIAAGTHTYTTKNKLKSFLNKDMKLYKNSLVLNAMIPKKDSQGKVVMEKNEQGQLVPVMVRKYDLEKGNKQGNIVFTDPHNGKTYVAIKKKEMEVDMINPKEIDPNTGKPKEFTVKQPRYELRIARFPVH